MPFEDLFQTTGMDQLLTKLGCRGLSDSFRNEPIAPNLKMVGIDLAKFSPKIQTL
jgi:hypothetical protein